MSSRRDAVPFDAHHFEKLARSGESPPAEAVFRDIYLRHHWSGSESASGAGANQEQTRQLRTALPRLLNQFGIDSLLDLPCGDHSWMRLIDLALVAYVGADLLPELVARLNATYAGSNRRFMVLDLTRGSLPVVDLLLCRDCLVHLSYSDIRSSLENVCRSGIRYFLTTTFAHCQVNEDIVTGDWRPLNLERPPFELPPPVYLLNEGCTEAGGLFGDKCLGLWPTDDLAELTFLAG